MVSWVTTADLVNVTGSAESSTVLQAIIDDAEREITAYLKARGVTASAVDACKVASLKLSKAGLLELWIQKGRYIATSGEFLNGADTSASSSPVSAINLLRKSAYDVLDDYVAVQESLSTPRQTYVIKVN